MGVCAGYKSIFDVLGLGSGDLVSGKMEARTPAMKEAAKQALIPRMRRMLARRRRLLR